MADNQDDNLRQAWNRRLGQAQGEADNHRLESNGELHADDQPTEVQSADVPDDALSAFIPPSVAPSPAPDAETSEEAPVGEEPKNRRWWLWAIMAAVVASLYVGLAFAFQDKIPANTSISGVQVGGMIETQARQALADGLHEELTSPRQVGVLSSDQQDTINPGNISLGIDYDETFKGLTGFSLDPRRIWSHISGAANVDAVLTADDEALAAETARLAEAFHVEPTDAELTIVDAATQVTDSEDGRSIDVDEAAEAIKADWLAGDAPIMLPTMAVKPALSTEDMLAFAEKSVDPLLAAPISITIKDVMVELQPAQTADIIAVTNGGGTPALTVDEAKLDGVVKERAGEVLDDPKDASIAITDGAPTITPSKSGESIDVGQIASALVALPEGSDRTIVAEVTTKEPEFTTEDAEKLGIKEVVSEISTPLTNDHIRTTNLVVGTRNVNNTLVKPGERFDLEKELGPIDEAHGYVSSGVVSNGFNSTAMGGGLSQLSTNTFNIGYRAGMVDVAHQPHSKYFDRYPMGLESTLWSGQIDMIWENNTPYGALVETWVGDGQVHTRLWSTKYWDVEVWQGAPFNYVQPETRTNNAADCEPSPAGGPGFSVKVGRVVKHGGEVHEDSEYTWTYQPVHAVRCE